MENFLEQYGYIALAIGTFFEGETAILVASSLIHQGLFDAPYTVFFGFAGSFISDWLYFIIGRLNGKYFVAKRPKLQQRLAPVRQFFDTHKIQILFSYRFLYGFRVIIPLIIGMSNLRTSQYLFYSVVSGIIWSSTVNAVGYSIGRFLDIKTTMFEENIFFIMLGFASFGLMIGYAVKHFAAKRMHVVESESVAD